MPTKRSASAANLKNGRSRKKVQLSTDMDIDPAKSRQELADVQARKATSASSEESRSTPATSVLDEIPTPATTDLSQPDSVSSNVNSSVVSVTSRSLRPRRAAAMKASYKMQTANGPVRGKANKSNTETQYSAPLDVSDDGSMNERSAIPQSNTVSGIISSTEAEDNPDQPLPIKTRANARKTSKQTKSSKQTKDVAPPTATEVVIKPDWENEEILFPKPVKYHPNGMGEGTGLDSSKPPIIDIEEIFAELTELSLGVGLRQALEHLDGRPLRVGTACSGTESPMLALSMVSTALSTKHQKPLNVEHVFSAEIEPYKQAYIERNFTPPIIFRDITEWTKAKIQHIKEKTPLEELTATTAYGAQVPIPGDLDILVSGSSCVDYSTLNNSKAEAGKIKDAGESSETFFGICDYVELWKPRILVLENIQGAPWDGKAKKLYECGYMCRYTVVDTRDYFLPQTRNRGYLVAVPFIPTPNTTRSWQTAHFSAEPAFYAVERWEKLMYQLRRPASSPASDFMLPANHPRLRMLFTGDSKSKGTGWEACRMRHSAARRDERLGKKRPGTQWTETGGFQGPDFGWQKWLRQQSDRVKDLLDITLLRKANSTKAATQEAETSETEVDKSMDVWYKSRVFELSQNVHMFYDSSPTGLAPCQTPAGIPFLSDRGTPMSGLDALALQGIPVRRVLLTTEKNSQLQDLAGNAMSSTVVGAAILSAIICAYDYVWVTDHPIPAQSALGLKTIARPCIARGSNLGQIQIPSSHSPTSSLDLKKTLAIAQSGARFCHCEDRYEPAPAIQECMDCGHTACTDCAGNPKHRYSLKEFHGERIAPKHCLDQLRALFPPIISLEGATDDVDFGDESEPWQLSGARGDAVCLSKLFMECVNKPMRLREFIRGPFWMVRYESNGAILDLVLTEQAEWRFYLKPNPRLPASSDLRDALKTPVAIGLLPDDDIFHVSWSFVCQHLNTSVSISSGGPSEWTPSFRSRLGLVDYVDEVVPKILHVSVENEAHATNISGKYVALPDCGQAAGSLYRRAPTDTDPHAMYFFLDPKRHGLPKFDSFVFSRDLSRLESDQHRVVLGRVDAQWRLPTGKISSEVHHTRAMLQLKRVTIPMPHLTLHRRDLAIELGSPLIGLKQTPLAASHDCNQMMVVYQLKSPLLPELKEVYQGSPLIDPNDDKFYTNFAWLLEPGRTVDFPSEWVHITTLLLGNKCDQCAPTKPITKWQIIEKKKGNSKTKTSCLPYEDPQAAARFERAIKHRPTVLAIKVDVSSSGNVELRFAVNIVSLIHRAWANLREACCSPGAIPWAQFRLNTDHSPFRAPNLPRFTIKHNEDDQPFTDNVGFKNGYDLHPAQKKSLTWMLARESEDAPPFTVKEYEEAPFPKLGWLAEAVVLINIHVRGGIIADRVSYGKTVTSLALIHQGFQREPRLASPLDLGASLGGTPLCKIKATLIVMPASLTGQWKKEIIKFLPPKQYGSKGDVLVINTFDQLTQLSFDDFAKAKIIILSFKVFEKNDYCTALANFVGGLDPHTSATTSRSFGAWLQNTTSKLPESFHRLRETGQNFFMRDNAIRQRQLKNNETLQNFVPSKRYRGAKYESKQAQGEAKKGIRTPIHCDEDDENLEPITPSDWRSMKGVPFLHLFSFNRLIIDEFSYLDARPYGLTKSICAAKKWILSGTPRLNDVLDIQTMARLIGAYLGVERSAEAALTPSNFKGLTNDLTETEKFHSFREANSPDWHELRHQHAQEFLDTFARQNDAKLDEKISCEEHFRPMHLNPEHLAIHMELTQNLITKKMSSNKEVKKGAGEQECKINLALGGVKDPAETLLTNACFLPELPYGSAIKEMIDIRRKEKGNLLKKLHEELGTCASTDFESQGKTKFAEWIAEWKKNMDDQEYSLHDCEAIKEINCIVQKVEAALKHGTLSKAPESLPSDVKNTNSGKFSSSDQGTGIGEANKKLNDCNSLSLAITKRTRSLRYMIATDNIQHSYQAGLPGPQCEGMDCTETSHQELAIITECGHVVCFACIGKRDDNFGCPAHDCNAIGLSESIIPANSLVAGTKPTGPTYGVKLDAILRDLDEKVGRDEKAILFVQNDTLRKHITKVLDEKADTDKNFRYNFGSTSPKIEEFKTKASIKVLVLVLTSQSAAGLNLTAANHIMFLSPLLRSNFDDYVATLTQAIGRARRLGQEKTVHIWRYIALQTVDVNIVEQRERRTSVLTSRESLKYVPVEWTHDGNSQEKQNCLVVKDGDDYAIVPSQYPRGHAASNLTSEQKQSFTPLIKLRQFAD